MSLSDEAASRLLHYMADPQAIFALLPRRCENCGRPFAEPDCEWPDNNMCWSEIRPAGPGCSRRSTPPPSA